MRLVRRLLALDDPQEVRFWLFLAAFATVIGVIYWFASYEIVGTLLLLGFGLATGLLGLRLHVDPGARRVRREAEARPAQPVPDVDVPAEGRAGVDRPFLDEEARLPAPTLAPLAVGAGVALIATGAIFGSAPVAVGLLPLGWGAWVWLAGARDELDALVLEDGEGHVEEPMPGGDGPPA